MTCPCLRRKRATCMSGHCSSDCPENCKEGFLSGDNKKVGMTLSSVLLLVMIILLGYLYYKQTV